MHRGFVTVLLVIAALMTEMGAAGPLLDAEVRKSLDARDYDTAIGRLQSLRDADPAAFAANDNDYVLAHVAEKAGRYSLAIASYERVARRGKDLAPYALAHISRLARSSGNLLVEREALTRLRLRYPTSSLADASFDRLADNLIEAGNYQAAVGLLTSTVPGANGGSPARQRDRTGRLALSLMFAGQTARARELFASLLDATNVTQPDDAALASVRGLDTLDGANASLPPADDLRRGGVYQYFRDFAAARRHYEAVANDGHDTSAATAMLQIGRGLVQQGNNAEAIGWFERIGEQYADDPAAKDGLLALAAAYSRVGKPDIAIARYQSFIQKYPADERLDRAYLNIVDVLRDRGEDQEALKWCSKTADAFKGKAPEAVAIFAATRIYIAREEWQAALENLQRLRNFADLGGAGIPGGTTGSETAFMRARVLEALGRYEEAVDTFISIPDGRGEYYGWLATGRLHDLARDEKAAPAIKACIDTAAAGLNARDQNERRRAAVSVMRMADDPKQREQAKAVFADAAKASSSYGALSFTEPELKTRVVARRLLDLSMYDDAATDLAGDESGSLSLARSRMQGDDPAPGLAIVESAWRKVPRDYPVEMMPRDQAELLYPVAYKDELLKYASARSVDPRLLLALIRQESRFQADANSNAAARGLMQFISTTANKVAGELGRPEPSAGDLYHPPTAILFGSQYTADLFSLFPAKPEAVVASFNGGEDNMKRWLDRSRSNAPERYVPEIMFTQTKDYVQKVMANYRMYCYLYNDRLEKA